MPRPAARQTEFFDLQPDVAQIWMDRLNAAFAGAKTSNGLLGLAEDAVSACPSHALILLMAATAAVLETRPERAFALLKRFSLLAKSPTEHVVHAIALSQSNRSGAARKLLLRHDMNTWPAVVRAFPAGSRRVTWLVRQLDGVIDDDGSGYFLRSAKGKTAKAASKTPLKKPAAAKPPPKALQTAQPAVSGAVSAAVSPLARINVEIPLNLEIDLSVLTATLARAPEPDGGWFDLRERLGHLSLAQGFDELLCLPHLTGFEPLWHQFETVRKVLKQFRGRVLLADEVGLGKTVEACMVLKEYALRGMAERTLVLTPASLVGQWREELDSKFGLAFATTYDPLSRDDPQAFWDQPHIVASIATARRREHAECLQQRKFDLVIVDEAHHLRDRASQGWKLVDALNKRFLLLLSATPVQNDLIELYNLLTLLKPGIFKTLKEFRNAHMTPGKPRQPANPERLRALMRDAMIRNTRAVVALKLPRRHATTIKVDGAPGEAEAYAGLVAAARRLASDGGVGKHRLTLNHLLSAGGSSPAAAAAAVARIAEKHPGDKAWASLAKLWTSVGRGGKETALIELVNRNTAEKKLVFVQSRETLHHLAGTLAGAGLTVACFHGSLSGPEKDAAIAQFRDHAQILLCTQSGGEGRNIQFCNTLINFDVPWNPMAIEQRIGRIDRIGQTREVFVFNLVTRGTLEEQVLVLLDEKIAMFELVVGEVGAILGSLEEDREFPDLVLEAWLEATEAGRAQAFEALGSRLDEARQQHEGAKVLDEKLFGQDFETA